jgi:hypothetical protein
MSDPFTIVSPENVELLSKYLDDRCLEPSDFPRGLLPVNSSHLLIERGYMSTLAAGRPFIFLEYLNQYGQPYLNKAEVPYATVRFLGSPKHWRGAEPPPKIISPLDRPNVLHYEPIQPLEGKERTWMGLGEGQIVLHVESMVKAKAVHKWTGFPTIGLNGVSSYSSNKRNIRFLYEDQEVDFSKFCNIVLFDSNIHKPAVRQAREQLMFKFKHILGCKDVRFVDLPKSDIGEDQGPDDYLRDKGNEALIELILKAESFKGQDFDDLLARMDRAVYCTKGGTIIDREDKQIRKPSQAKDFYAPINEKVMGKGGKVNVVKGYDIWLESPSRSEVVNPAYRYLGEEIVDRQGMPYYNKYIKSGPWPESPMSEELIEPVLKHLRSIMKVEDLERLRSYLKYLKYTGDKPTSFPVIYSDKRGVGKGWFAKIAYRLIGSANATNVKARAFVSNFNKQIAEQRLVVANEFKLTSASDKDSAMNSIKIFFGDEMLPVEPKGVDSYEVENGAGMIITANELADVPTDGMEDRRMWYVECHAPDYEPDWRKLHSMIDEPEVMEAIASWVNRGELMDFATWRPPLDEDRIRAIRRSSSGIDDSCSIALEDLRAAKLVVASYESIKEMLRDQLPKVDEYTPRQVGLSLVRAGWKKSERRYGRTPATQRFVWIIDDKAYDSIWESSKSVEAEIARTASYIIGGAAKY